MRKKTRKLRASQETQTRNACLRSRRQQESIKQMEQQRQAGNDDLRARRQQVTIKQVEKRGDRRRALNSLINEDKPDENLTDNADKDNHWLRLILGSHCLLNTSLTC